MRLLLQAGSYVAARREDGRTPLHTAWAAEPEAIAMLLDAGVDVNARDSSGRTACEVLQGRPRLEESDVWERICGLPSS